MIQQFNGVEVISAKGEKECFYQNLNYHEPLTVDEACRIMGELGRNAKPLAGGTDLIVNMKKKVLSPAHVVSLSGIADLKGLDSANGTIKIGACLTASEIAQSEILQRSFSALCKGAGSLGSPLIRNLATIAGNLVSARPAADFPPTLLAYDAKVALKIFRRKSCPPD